MTRRLRDSAADNSATAFLPKREKIPVHLHAPKGNLFLQMVLAANPLVTLTTSRELPKDTPAATIKVYHVETPAVIQPTRFARETAQLQPEYFRCWQGLKKHFDPSRP